MGQARSAHEGHVRVVLVLFSGAQAASHEACSLFSSERVLQSLLRNAVVPLAAALRDRPGLAMWEVARRAHSRRPELP